ncbi:MAG TPA: ABC transporter substrate-binding protein [Beijerinckiaceae bacterium]|jgi:putative ABC transport system substrate-binding protein
MRRREVIAGGLLAALAAAKAGAQQPQRIRRIGVLMGVPSEDEEAKSRVAALEGTLAGLGWSRERNLQIEYRWADGGPDHIRAAARELVALACDVIVARSTVVASALAHETSTIPIVVAGMSDPIASGLAKSLSRPESNVTGFVNYDPSLVEKWLEFLKAIAPGVRRTALLFNPESSTFAELFDKLVREAAPVIGIEPVLRPVHNERGLAAVIEEIARDRASGLIVIPDIFMTKHRREIARLAAASGVPAVYPNRFYAESGGLLSYSVDNRELTVRAAAYVDRILKGASAAELPIQRPTKYELVINLKTARAMGVDIPPTLLARADEVIE